MSEFEVHFKIIHDFHLLKFLYFQPWAMFPFIPRESLKCML